MRSTQEFPTTPYLEVAERFAAKWVHRSGVLGVVLVGSYAVGLQTPMSDIDICIILADSEKRWRRGHFIRDGYLIEYAAYPIQRVRQLWTEDIKDARRLRARMLAMGIIMHDTDGAVSALKKEAIALMSQSLPKPNETKLEMDKYFLWDQLDNLRDMERMNSDGFAYTYYACMQKLIEFFASANGWEIPRPNRLFRFLSDPDFAKQYGIASFPDAKFAELFSEAMGAPSLENIELITRYVHDMTGGFNVNRWRLSGHVA